MELADALTREVVVLDGGMSTALELAGHDLSDALWSGRLLLTDPDAVRDAHLAFYRAGAEVAITASYQVTFEGFGRHGISAVTHGRGRDHPEGVARRDWQFDRKHILCSEAERVAARLIFVNVLEQIVQEGEQLR